MRYIALYFFVFSSFFLVACDTNPDLGGDTSSFPKRDELKRNEARGRLTGDGLVLGGGDEEEGGGNSPIGVNSFLWRATLDTLAFLPLVSADPFGGVIITDWYEDPNARGERFKVTALILGRSLRADGVKISLFKQGFDAKRGVWQDEPKNAVLARKLEDTILTRARQLRIGEIKR